MIAKLCKNTEEIIEAMKNGYTLDYAPMSGGCGLFNHADDSEDVYMRVNIINDFLDLQAQNIIKHVSTQWQGHILFYGRVDIYELVK